jgi:hypothetical protein
MQIHVSQTNYGTPTQNPATFNKRQLDFLKGYRPLRSVLRVSNMLLNVLPSAWAVNMIAIETKATMSAYSRYQQGTAKTVKTLRYAAKEI